MILKDHILHQESCIPTKMKLAINAWRSAWMNNEIMGKLKPKKKSTDGRSKNM